MVLPPSRHPGYRPALPLGRANLGTRHAAGRLAAAAGADPAAGASRPPPQPPTASSGSESRRSLQPGDQLDPNPRPPRLDLPRPDPRRRRRPLAPPRRHQSQERHHPLWPAVRLLSRHPVPTHRGRTPRLQPLPRLRGLEHGGDLRAAARALREQQSGDRRPVSPIPTAQAVDGARLLGELRRRSPAMWPSQPPGRRRRHPVDRGHPRPAGLGARPPPGRLAPLEALRQVPPAGRGRRDLP